MVELPADGEIPGVRFSQGLGRIHLWWLDRPWWNPFGVIKQLPDGRWGYVPFGLDSADLVREPIAQGRTILDAARRGMAAESKLNRR
jgi:hypothetical protein